MSLRDDLIKLAREKPEIRGAVLPLLRRASDTPEGGVDTGDPASAKRFPKFWAAQQADSAVARQVYHDPLGDPDQVKPTDEKSWEALYNKVRDHAKKLVTLHEDAAKKFKAAESEVGEAVDPFGVKLKQKAGQKAQDHIDGTSEAKGTVETYEKAIEFLKKYHKPSMNVRWTNLDR
jgi:hypothetical protein